MREVRVLEEATHLGDVVTEQQIVVRQVADDPALGLMEDAVPVRLAVSPALREVEESDSRIGGVPCDDLTGRVLDPVPDDEHLHRCAFLVERALEGVRKQRDVPVRRDEDARIGHDDQA